MMGDEGIDHFVQRFARQDLVELVEREIDPVVGKPALRKIIGADAFGAIAGTDLGTPVRGALGVKYLALQFVRSWSVTMSWRGRGSCAANARPARRRWFLLANG